MAEQTNELRSGETGAFETDAFRIDWHEPDYVPAAVTSVGIDADIDAPAPSEVADALAVLPEIDASQTVVDPAAFDAIDAELTSDERRADVNEVGKDLARILGAKLVAEMLEASPLSLREIHERYGFDHAALSRMANGNSRTGPTLWKLYALAEALGFAIHLKLVKR